MEGCRPHTITHGEVQHAGVSEETLGLPTGKGFSAVHPLNRRKVISVLRTIHLTLLDDLFSIISLRFEQVVLKLPILVEKVVPALLLLELAAGELDGPGVLPVLDRLWVHPGHGEVLSGVDVLYLLGFVHLSRCALAEIAGVAGALACGVIGAQEVAWVSSCGFVVARLLLAEVEDAFEVEALKAALGVIAEDRVKTLVLLPNRELFTLLLARVPVKVV